MELQLHNNGVQEVPIWINLPGLPLHLWNTKSVIRSRLAFARILVNFSAKEEVKEWVKIKDDYGNSFFQKVASHLINTSLGQWIPVDGRKNGPEKQLDKRNQGAESTQALPTKRVEFSAVRGASQNPNGIGMVQAASYSSKGFLLRGQGGVPYEGLEAGQIVSSVTQPSFDQLILGGSVVMLFYVINKKLSDMPVAAAGRLQITNTMVVAQSHEISWSVEMMVECLGQEGFGCPKRNVRR
ncbi:hypothetical protein NE237_018410 [Protea cynaroides]|uniref:DUF4283 domain-containing protein n=1 Tax=Protea cynaroides TaxID=273540 RepID=A0A9Q0K9Z6_9MAGN|nr:hypothetical protein NE237_018410 [Protea cynaroides]